MTPDPNSLARNWAAVHHTLNIYRGVKRSVFYITHGCYHKPLQERSFCTIVLYHRRNYWLSICMKNLVLLTCIYSYLTSCILCSFELNRLDRWIAVGSKKLIIRWIHWPCIYLSPKNLISMEICPCLCGYSFTKTCSREVMTGSCRLVFRCSFSFLKN